MSVMIYDYRLIQELSDRASNRPDNQEDLAAIRQARNATCYGEENPLVEWTLSASWEEQPSRGGPRGAVIRGADIFRHDGVMGELGE